MRAVVLERYGGRDVLKMAELPDPMPGPGEVRIRIKAAGVNPVDWKIREGFLKDRLPNQFPIIPGWDAAGVIDRVGEGVTQAKAGDEVYAYCRKPVIQFGTYAEYVVVPESFVAPKPKCLSFEEAAAIPLAALTAWQSLFDAAQLKAGQYVLIHAAAGGVGGYAVQLAREKGAHVIGTCGESNLAFVSALGAAKVIDYTKGDFREQVRALVPGGVDVGFDTVGGEVQVRSADVVRRDGVLVSILAYADEVALQAKGIRTRYVFVAPNSAQLREIGALVDAGRMRPYIMQVFPLEQAAAAQALVETKHVRGKVVLRIA